MRKTIQTKNGEFQKPAPMKKGAVIVRAAAMSDLDGLMVLEGRAFGKIYAGHLMNRAEGARFIEEANALVLVAQKGQALAGYALLLFRKNSDMARLYSIASDPALSGQGIGTALMAEVEEFCRASRTSQITLEAHEANRAVLEWYKRLGFRQYGKSEDGFYADGSAAVKMRKTLHISLSFR